VNSLLTSFWQPSLTNRDLLATFLETGLTIYLYEPFPTDTVSCNGFAKEQIRN